MKTLEQLQLDNSYIRLAENFYSRVAPLPQGEPYLVSFNPAAAGLIDLDPNQVQRADFADIFSGRKLLPGSEPIAAVYAGHQFGVYVPRLGDGRAMLLGEVLTDAGARWDLQLKGAGPTPYSRMGDGYAVLRSTIREYLCAEAMHGLGIATTRALCIVGSDAPVYRETVETGATLLRMAPSHVRFGSFEYFSHTGQHELLRQLADYMIGHHYPHLAGNKEKYARFFSEVVERTARLLAQWQAVGFAHGVMNTDNMSILGLTIDYGPFGFLVHYQPDFICNHSDHGGRYAFNRQPNIALWNLACLAQSLLPLLDEQTLRAALDDYAGIYNNRYIELMQHKLGLQQARPDDTTLIQDLLGLMAQSNADYTNTLRALSQFQSGAVNKQLRDRFIDRDAFDAWAKRYAQRLELENSIDQERAGRMNRLNPKYILRNYLAQAAIARAQQKDFSEIDLLLDLLADPYSERPDRQAYAAEPPDWGRHIEVSCSS
jgi:uncharacterized protein YdiU (UPF0061 family)